jgi:hypothetical protein
MLVRRSVGAAAGAFITAAIAVLIGTSEAQARRVALVIGNAAYENTAPLTNPRNDAEDVSVALTRLGFEVIKGIDLKKSAMERTIRNFANALIGADMGLFFYAGHGLQVAGVNYLVPIDAQLSTASALDFEMIRLDLIQRAMETESQTNVILLDACRDNPLARNLARALGTRSASIGRGLAQFEAGVGTLISFSTQPGNVALDGTGRNSPYAAALIKHIATPAESLTSILIRVRNDVISATANRQVPWDQHALRKSIFLAGRGVAIPPPSAESPPSSDDGARAWAATKDTTSIAVLKTFADRYRGSIYADLAKARIEELQRDNKSAMYSPAPRAERSHMPAPPVGGAAECTQRDGLSACASSMLATAGVNTSHYGTRNLLDGDKQTAWVEGVDGDGIGEWLVLSWSTERNVKGFRIANGYGKTPRLFDRNGRVSKLALTFSSGERTTLTLDDTADERTYMLPRPFKAMWVRFEILGNRRGTKYSDTAISELRPIFE